MLLLIAVLIVSYLIGGIPFSFIVAKALKGVDLRQIGSGNVGATNASRLFPKPWSLLVFLLCFCLDAAKGYISAFFLSRYVADGILRNFSEIDCMIFVGLAAILGHVFTPYLRFRGGKGVATSLGVFLAAAPLPVLLTVLIGITIILLTRYVSVGSIIMAIILPIAVYVQHPREWVLLGVTILVGLFIIFKHRTNMQRLMQGNESKLFAKKSTAQT